MTLLIFVKRVTLFTQIYFYLRFDLKKDITLGTNVIFKGEFGFQMVIIVGPLPEGLQYWADPWRGLSKPSTPRLRPKISLIS